MKRSFFARWSSVLVLGLFLAAPAGAEVRLKYENLAYNKGRAFSFPVPADLKAVWYSFAGRGKAAMTVTACRIPQNLNDNKNGMHSGAILGVERKYPVQMRSFSRNQRPDLQNCSWGVFVSCIDPSGCEGVISVWWDKWDGTSSRGTDPDATARPGAGGQAGGESTGAAETPTPPPAASGADIGDAGTNNMEAARIQYGCRVEGTLRQGDYDNFAFFFPGGAFRARSAAGLDLVADLLDAKGRKLARAGADTPQFDIQGNYPAGQYYLIIRVMHHAGAGPYQVQLGPDTGCHVTERP